VGACLGGFGWRGVKTIGGLGGCLGGGQPNTPWTTKTNKQKKPINTQTPKKKPQPHTPPQQNKTQTKKNQKPQPTKHRPFLREGLGLPLGVSPRSHPPLVFFPLCIRCRWFCRPPCISLFLRWGMFPLSSGSVRVSDRCFLPILLPYPNLFPARAIPSKTSPLHPLRSPPFLTSTSLNFRPDPSKFPDSLP